IGSTATVTAQGWRIADGAVSPPATFSACNPAPVSPQNLKVLQVSNVSAKVVIPSTWLAGEYAIRLTNSSTKYSAPACLNQTTPPWWLGGDRSQACPGGVLQVFGKNLGSAPQAWLGS